MAANSVHSRESWSKAVALCTLAYVAAAGVALVVGYTLRHLHPILIVLAADLAATITVFGFSVAFDNSSFYDPYWSVAPIPIALFWALAHVSPEVNSGRQVVVLILLSWWAVRLTYNWLRRWRGLGDEDWRYVDLRRKSGRAYWLVSFAGIHLLPTGMVFLGCLALYPALSAGTRDLGLLDGLATVVTAAAIWIEMTADRQLRRFTMTPSDTPRTLTTGLWAYSRHPNYLGEVSFWWGLFLFALAANPSYWWTIVGPLSMTIMFLLISIPMIDERMLKRRPLYADRMKKVPALFPWFPGR